MFERRMIVGNWKMHLRLPEAEALLSEINAIYKSEIVARIPVVLCVPHPYLQVARHHTRHTTLIEVGAQTIHHAPQGAFTGCVSAEMVASVEAQFSLVGHSERRRSCAETPDCLREQIDRALEHRLRPIYCLGETLEERRSGKAFEVVAEQLRAGLWHLTAEQMPSVILAYEPVWAIGAGQAASSADAQEIHAHLRSNLAEQFGSETAHRISILYGGSVKQRNAAELFQQPDIDGGLVGGASLDAREFIEILKYLDYLGAPQPENTPLSE